MPVRDVAQPVFAVVSSTTRRLPGPRRPYEDGDAEQAGNTRVPAVPLVAIQAMTLTSALCERTEAMIERWERCCSTWEGCRSIGIPPPLPQAPTGPLRDGVVPRSAFHLRLREGDSAARSARANRRAGVMGGDGTARWPGYGRRGSPR